MKYSIHLAFSQNADTRVNVHCTSKKISFCFTTEMACLPWYVKTSHLKKMAAEILSTSLKLYLDTAQTVAL